MAADAKELDCAVKLLRITEIIGINLRNALTGNLRELDVSSGNKGSQNRNLAAGIVALNIRLRILLRIAVVLCLLQRDLKRKSFLLHLGQNVVRRSVQDAHDRGNELL